MFVDSDEGNLLFPDLIEAMWTLWICVTTANYPDVMMPGYNQNRWVALYFVTFMTISFFFLMNLVLAQVINEYDSAVESHRKQHIAQSRQNLDGAFELLQEANEIKSDTIERATVMDLFSILNLDFPEFRTLSEDDTKLLFAILDRDGSNVISKEEFMDFGNVLLLEFVNAKVYMSVMEKYYPAFYQGSFWQRVCSAVNSDAFETALDIVLILNAVVVAIQSWPELSRQDVHLDKRYWDGSIDTVWEVMETVFTIIYVLEASSKILVNGWRKYIESARNVFDFSVTVVAVVGSAIVYYPNEFSDSRLIRMILSARVLRLLRLLTALEPFQLIGRISAEILPAASSVTTVLFLVMYFFAAMVSVCKIRLVQDLNFLIRACNYMVVRTQQTAALSLAQVIIVTGMITRDPRNPLSLLLLESEFADSEYWANNFNDMFSGMNVRQYSVLLRFQSR